MGKVDRMTTVATYVGQGQGGEGSEGGQIGEGSECEQGG